MPGFMGAACAAAALHVAATEVSATTQIATALADQAA